MSERSEILQTIEKLQSVADRLPDVDPAESVPFGIVHVTEARLSQITGFSLSRLESMRRRGTVKKGVHWFKNSAGIFWGVEAFKKWQEGEQDPDTQASRLEKAGPSGSVSHIGEAGSTNRSTSRPRRRVKRKPPGSDSKLSNARG